MKKSFLTLSGLATIVVFLLTSCGGGGGSTTTTNEYLGKLPALEKKYYEKITEIKQEIKESSDLKGAFELSKKQEALQEERDKKIDEYIASNPLTKPLPFEALSGTPYTIKEVTVNKASAGNLNIKFSVTIDEDMKNKYGGIEKTLFIYYKAVDSQGTDIPDSKTVATNFKRIELKKGVEYEAFGSWQSDEVSKMEDFAKIVEITKEEYNK